MPSHDKAQASNRGIEASKSTQSDSNSSLSNRSADLTEFGGMIETTLDLKAQTSLHVGSGKVTTIKGRESLAGNKIADDEVSPEVALVYRDFEDRPYIPGSTIKGALRSISMRNGLVEEDTKTLFGERDASDGSASGYLHVYAAEHTGEPPETRHMPYGEQVRDGAYMSARTAIDPETKTADEHKLFFLEMVPPETRFTLRVKLIPRPKQDQTIWPDVVSAFGRLLKILEDTEFSLGKGKSAGEGRVSCRFNDESLKRQLNWASIHGPQVTPSSPAWKLILTCDGPFIIADSSHIPSEEDDITVSAQKYRLEPNQPLITGAGIKGALRARYRRVRYKEAQKGNSDFPTDSEIFGDTEHQARLKIDLCSIADSETQLVTQVALDRFTAGSMPSMLFTTEVFWGGQIELRLHLAPSHKKYEAAIEHLLIDLERDEIAIGAGEAKGFGWMTAEWKASDVN